MKTILSISCALLAVSATMEGAGAAGINLSWGDCGPAGVSNMTFACNTNAGTHILIGSFIAPCCVTAAISNEFVLDLQTAGVTLSPWWNFQTDGCRAGSMAANFDFTAGPFSCLDYWNGAATGSASATAGLSGSNPEHITGRGELPAGSTSIRPIDANTEVYSFKLIISHRKTVGMGACGGCFSPGYICLNSIRVNQPAGVGDILIQQPADRNWVLYQTGYSSGLVCFYGDPVRNTTWGAVKASYRGRR